jgi:hypothetical protein
MPRDVGNTTLLLKSPFTAWDRLGIIPVPEDFVKQYKKDYRAERGYSVGSRWLTVRFNPKTWDLKTFLRDGLRNRGDNTHYVGAFVTDKTAAPKKLVALALHVQEHFPDAKFETHCYQHDPVLYATLDGQKGCLGIWDNGELIACAAKVRSYKHAA